MADLGKNTDGVPFNSRIVKKGEAYGLDNCLVHEEDEPLVEFYDATYPFHADPEGNVLGQFVSRYYAGTLTGEDEFSFGDCRVTGVVLDGCVPCWFVTGEQVAKALAELEA